MNTLNDLADGRTTLETLADPVLGEATVLVVGVGALGSPVALQLAAAGVGRLLLMDPDTVELSNLHRQIVHRSADIGRAKVESARDLLRRLHPTVAVDARHEALDAGNAERSMRGVDFIVDASDGAASKFLINDAAVATARPFSYAGVVGLEGQCTTVLPGRTPCLRCIFRDPPLPGTVPTCREAGVLGPVAGVIGSVQASEAIRVLTGRPPLLGDGLLTYEARSRRWRRVPLTNHPRCAACVAIRERGPEGRPDQTGGGAAA